MLPIADTSVLWFNATTSVGRAPASSTHAPVAAQRLGPNDPLNRHLTDAGRSAIKTSTGVDIRSDGGILLPASMT